MKHRYLEVTFRKGKPLAAYLYLPRPAGAKAARTTDAGHGLRVDFDAQGTPIGVEITAPAIVSVAQLNELLLPLGVARLEPEEWSPLAA
ncbi:MAG: hypothetical protein ACRENE_26525 [Polyangiaceae bacterium]